MEASTPETLRLLLERSGLKLSADDMEQLRPVFEQYMKRVNELHAVDLSDEEVAGVFRPELPLEGEVSR
jgi:hypothetical protein